MDDKTLLQALRRLKVETGSLACLGCGHEHNCDIHGCAIIREAAERIEGLLKNETQLRKERRNSCMHYGEDGVCEHFSEPGITSYCVEGPCSAYLPEGLTYGDNIKLSGTETPAEIKEAKALLAKQAGKCMERALLQRDAFIEGEGTLGWKVEIHKKKLKTAAQRVSGSFLKCTRADYSTLLPLRVLALFTTSRRINNSM